MGSKGLYERVYKGSNGSKDRVEKVSRVLGRGWIMISDSNNSQGNIYIKKVSAQNNMKPISKLEGKNITNKK